MRNIQLLLLVVVAVYLVEGFRSLKGTTSTDFCARNRKAKSASRTESIARVRRQTEDCEARQYRSGDGWCNNVNNPEWGAGGQLYQRLRAPAYDDEVGVPRLKYNGTDNYLPPPRNISVLIHDFDHPRPHPRGTVMLMEWGQFLAHDIAATPVDSETPETDCCTDIPVDDPNFLHDDVLNGGPCFPIIIPAGDRYFTSEDHRCMEFVRSRPEYDSDGVRQQVNELSAYIDAQNVYGYDDLEMSDLREKSGGRLLLTEDSNLPESQSNVCIVDEGSGDYCLQAGDSRVNVYPGLGALHTVFARFHNYLATELAKNHADWDDETLFQTARKINIAVIQRITYTEYLPMIISPNYMTAYGLNSEYTYNPTCDATLYNVFATAAFRFGHSMVPDSLLINGQKVPSVELYDNPHHVLNNLDSVVSGLASEAAERADRWYSLGMTDQLFEVDPQDGFDIASLNIQRGRDHGLAPYNDWREECGLPMFTHWVNLTSSSRYEDMFTTIDDIDLYTGALNEKPVEKGSVGETYACLLAKQFANLRNCDRFWYETTNTTVGFATSKQLGQIKKIKLSHILCRTTGITQLQKNVFQLPSDLNPVTNCSELLLGSMGLKHF